MIDIDDEFESDEDSLGLESDDVELENFDDEDLL